MPSSHPVSYFAPPLARWQQPRSFRTARYEPRKRRKKSPLDGDSDSDGTGYETDAVETESQMSGRGAAGDATRQSSYSSTPARSSVLLSPDEAHQYRIAGHSMDNELPGGNFPHSVASADKTGKITKNHVETELSELRHPVFVPDAGRNSLHLRHLAVVTTILHRCLMEGDYIRAGRAWGLLLRDDFSGHPIDVRTEGRWGIGAEILLRGDSGSRSSDQPGAAATFSENLSAPNRKWFSRDGFEKAKSYYERLILQYPYRKVAPHALSPLHFYPAMYSLWIATVQEESRAMRDAPLADEDNFDAAMGEPDDAFSRQDRRSTQVTVQSYRKELAEAQQIASQMDELLFSFPFSDSYELLRLRGMVSLWIADLHVSSVTTGDDENRDFDNDGDFPMEDPSDMGLEERLAKERKTAELEKAQAFLDKANARASRV